MFISIYVLVTCVSSLIADECLQVCSPFKSAVCGTNGITYRNECYLRRAACLHNKAGVAVRMSHYGECQLEVDRPVDYGSIVVSNGGPWGDWGTMDFCPLGSYATGFKLKLEIDVVGDDTALNGIELTCSTPQGVIVGAVRSSEGPWGEWIAEKACPQGLYLAAFELRVEAESATDDTAANNLQMTCRNVAGKETTSVLTGQGTDWGSWGGISKFCPVGEVVCGIQTLVEPDKGNFVDDTALNDVAFDCCAFDG